LETPNRPAPTASRGLHDQFHRVWRIEPPGIDFRGRDELLDSVAAEFETGKRRIFVLHGPPSMGKTKFALALAERLKKQFPDGGHKVDLRGYDRQRRTAMLGREALETLIRGLLVNRSVSLPDSEDELHGLYHGLLNEKSRRVLLLLDNAQDAAQVEKLLPTKNCAVIVTSRRKFSLHGVPARKLLPFDKTAGVQMLREFAPQLSGIRVQTPARRRHGAIVQVDAAEYAAELLGYMPHALAVFASTVVQQSVLYPVAELVERLRSGRLRELDEVHAAVELSWELLPEHLKLRFEQLGVFPGEFHWHSAAAVWCTSPEAAGPDFQSLVDLNLVEDGAGQYRFRLHDVLRDYARQKLSKRRENALDQVTERLARHFAAELKSAGADYTKGNEAQNAALDVFEREKINIEACLDWAQRNHEKSAAAADICSLLWRDARYLLSHCLSHRERLPLAESSRAAARKNGDTIAEVRALHQRGMCFALDGRGGDAKSSYEEAMRLLDNVGTGTAVTVLRASVKASLGWHYIDVGDFAEAISTLSKCLPILKKQGEVYDELIAVEGLGEAIMLSGKELQTARNYFHYVGIRLDRQFGSQRAPTVYDILALRCLGWSFALEGKPRKGITPCLKAVKLARDALKHPRIESIARARLAFCCWKAGKICAAIVEYNEALKLATQWSLGGKVEILADLWTIAIQTKRTDMANWAAEAFLQCKSNKRYAATTKRIEEWLATMRRS